MALTYCQTDEIALRPRLSAHLLGQFVAVLLGLGFLSGCAATKHPDTTGWSALPSTTPSDYREIAAPGMSCVPYARRESGLGLRGDAYTWWNSAAGTYDRGQVPRPGAVLVLSKTSRLQSGHLAIVSQVIGPRQILVDHANWVPGRIIVNMPVIDISENNDWTALRFWYQPAKTFGDTYAALGFIYRPDSVATPVARKTQTPAPQPPAITPDQTIVISGSGVSVSPASIGQ